MNALKKTPIAIIIMVAAIALSSLFGCRRSLIDERLAVESGFHGESGSIQSELSLMISHTTNFRTIAIRYIEESDPLITELVAARDTLSKAEGASESYLAATRLYAAVKALNLELSNHRMNSQDRIFSDSSYDEIALSMKHISESEYNRDVEKFNTILNGFPAKQIAGLFGIEPLELFGGAERQ